MELARGLAEIDEQTNVDAVLFQEDIVHSHMILQSHTCFAMIIK